mmetsp:Transcript_62675/g.167664  ORF Transcript_62675/g.167664 Transcript_62675/m.167664 type:complete len:218 (-) Transcript_62675:58-711(-)
MRTSKSESKQMRQRPFRKTLAGFRFRWTMPWLCTCSSPCSICCSQPATTGPSSASSLARPTARGARRSPSSAYSVTVVRRPEFGPTPFHQLWRYTATFGWRSFFRACTSWSALSRPRESRPRSATVFTTHSSSGRPSLQASSTSAAAPPPSRETASRPWDSKLARPRLANVAMREDSHQNRTEGYRWSIAHRGGSETNEFTAVCASRGLTETWEHQR